MDKKKEYYKQYYKKNKERMNATSRAYYWNNRARQLMLCKEWANRQKLQLKEREKLKLKLHTEKEDINIFRLKIT